jgi:hypothetical protein
MRRFSRALREAQSSMNTRRRGRNQRVYFAPLAGDGKPNLGTSSHRTMVAIRHVIWDFNGTLLDDMHCCIGALSTLLAERELPALTIERYREEFGFPVEAFYASLGFDFSREDFDVVTRTFIDRYLVRLADARTYEGAHDALRRGDRPHARLGRPCARAVRGRGDHPPACQVRRRSAPRVVDDSCLTLIS